MSFHAKPGPIRSMGKIDELVRSIDSLLGQHSWEGDDPFLVDVEDRSTGTAWRYEFRMGPDWITMRVCSSETIIVHSYLLEKKGKSWEYVDPCLIKYKTSSLQELLDDYSRIEVAIKSSGLGGDVGRLVIP